MDLRLSGEDPAVATVGYLLGPWARGLGYASAGLRALCAFGFGTLGLRRIEWWASVGNHASRRVAERAGFRMEGVVRGKTVHRGEPGDSWTGARLASDAEVTA
jgi:RimJ/RimL family protein N-acetyltransferase